MDLFSDKRPQAGSPAQQPMDQDDPPAASYSRPLDQEPLLAARIMVEDCMGLLLDIDDIDRLLVQPAGMSRERAPALHQRRALLMSGITSSFRLPTTPSGTVAAVAATDAGEGSSGMEEGDDSALAGGGAGVPTAPPADDGVFLRIMGLHKGRTLLARVLQRAVSPPSASLGADGSSSSTTAPLSGAAPDAPTCSASHLLWAALRTAVHLFGSSAFAPGFDGRALAPATASVAAAICDFAARTVQVGSVVAAVEAFLAGVSEPEKREGLLPLSLRPGVDALQGKLWLGDALTALLTRAEQLGLGPNGAVCSNANAPPLETASSWTAAVSLLVTVVSDHLHAVSTSGIVANSSSSGSSSAEEANTQRQLLQQHLTYFPLVDALMRHASDEERVSLEACLPDRLPSRCRLTFKWWDSLDRLMHKRGGLFDHAVAWVTAYLKDHPLPVGTVVDVAAAGSESDGHTLIDRVLVVTAKDAGEAASAVAVVKEVLWTRALPDLGVRVVPMAVLSGAALETERKRIINGINRQYGEHEWSYDARCFDHLGNPVLCLTSGEREFDLGAVAAGVRAIVQQQQQQRPQMQQQQQMRPSMQQQQQQRY